MSILFINASPNKDGNTVRLAKELLAGVHTVFFSDCIYLHHPAGDHMTAWRALEEAYRQGKVHSKSKQRRQERRGMIPGAFLFPAMCRMMKSAEWIFPLPYIKS